MVWNSDRAGILSLIVFTKPEIFMQKKKYLLISGLIILASITIIYLGTRQPKTIKLTSEQLSTLTGFYNAREMNEFHLEILVKKNQLVLRQWWDGREIVFVPLSETKFKAVDSRFLLEFTKDKSGVATQLLALGKDLWIRDNYYKPVERKMIHVDPLSLKKFEGKYELSYDTTRVAQVWSNENGLLIKQLWDEVEYSFVPQSAMQFFVKDNPAMHIRFLTDKAGVVNGLMAYEREVLVKQ
jgi:hypothetical protein